MIQRVASDVIQSLREGFGLVVSEGMWKGKPVVGGDVGGIRLRVEDGRARYLVDGAEACARAIVRLLRDPGLAASMGPAGREVVRERFLSTREMRHHVGLLARLV